MPGSFEFLRATLGLIGAGCAAMSARALFGVRRGWLKPSKAVRWLVRTLACLAGAMLRQPLDALGVAVLTATAAAAGAGWFFASRSKPPEDLAGTIFPHQD